MSEDKRRRGGRTDAGGGKNAGGMGLGTGGDIQGGGAGESTGGGRGTRGPAQREHGVGPTMRGDSASTGRAGRPARNTIRGGATSNEESRPIQEGATRRAGPGGGRAGRSHAQPRPDADDAGPVR